MSKIKDIISGNKIYPYINNRYVKLLIKLDIKKQYDNFIKELKNDNIAAPSTYDEFVIRIQEDENFKKIIKEHYENEDIKLITDSSYENIHIVELKDNPPKDNYIFGYVSKICNLNMYDMFMNYKDLFGNEIVFK